MSRTAILRQHGEQAERTNEAQFRAIFDASSAGMALTDRCGRLTRVNAALCSMTGYTADELAHRSLRDLASMPAMPGFDDLLVGTTLGYRAEHAFRRNDGSTAWVDLTVNALSDAAGLVVVVQDVSHRKLREEAAMHQQQIRLFEGITSTTPDFVYAFDLEGRFLYANRRLLEVWGMKLPDVIGKTCRELGYEQWHHDMHMREIAEVISTRRPIKGEVPFTAPLTGVYGVYEYIFTPVLRPDGTVDMIAGTTRDVTQRKRAEEELRNRSEQFQTLLNQAPIGVYLVDADFRIAQANPIAIPVFGNIPGLIGRDFGEVIRILWEKEYAAEVIALFRRTLETGEACHMSERAQLRADRGVVEYYDWHIERITLPDGRLGVVCYFIDISDQVRARRAIAESETRYHTLFQSIDEGFCIVQLIYDDEQKPVDYRFLEVNPAFEKQGGMKNPVGRTIREMIPEMEDTWVRKFGEVALSGQATRFVDHARALGRWFDVYAFRAGKAEEHRVAVLFNDITPRKDAESALAKTQEELQKHAAALEATVADRTARLRETVQQLETFSYSIVHDMRAPLRSMRSFAGLLQDDYQDKLDENGRRYIQRIMNAAGRLDALITDVLSYSRITMNDAVLHRVDMDRLVGDIISTYPQFEDVVRLIHVRGPLPAVIGNSTLLTQVLTNLLGNAFKFVTGREPRVEIRAETLGEVMRFWVEDNGIGIAPEYHTEIFNLFHRLHSSEQYAGTGVGLAIVKAAIQRMGGRVGVESVPGEGSRFWFELPGIAAANNGQLA